MRRVVVTGMDLTSPLGSSTQSAFERLKTYQNCVEYWPTLDNIKNMHTRLCTKVKDFVIPEHFTRKVTRTMGPISIMAVRTAENAFIDSGLLGDDIITNGQTGVSYGSSSGSMSPIKDFYMVEFENELKGLNSGSYIKLMSQTAGVNISLYLKTKGRFLPSSTACTSGSLSIGMGYEAIKYGHQDVMIVGGAEELCPSHIGVFDTLYATSQKNDTPNLTPSPFDRDRDGLVIGEGAGTLILEEYEHAKNRGAKIYAEIVGFATNTDGTHITNPNSETMQIVMEKAIKDANISSDEIGYVNAHGTGTKNGDIAETTATYGAFKRQVPISSIKSYTGHTLGACGAIEAILSIMMMNNNWFSPNLNLENIDPECGDLDYIVGTGRNIETQYVMTNNFAFGGINTSLVFKGVKG